MEAPIIAALIAGFVAVIGGSASLYATYRLKVKEFRVAQVKSRIETLEQAAVAEGRESQSPEDKTEEHQDPVSTGINEAKIAAWYRLGATEKQYRKYKWLLKPESHGFVDKLLGECNRLSNKLVMDSATHDVEKFKEDLPLFIEKTRELRNAYEQARLSAIERLYFVLNKEVGI